jgi:hypothetical protein
MPTAKLNIDNRDQLASAMTADQISHSR